ncbi:hypothetical protein [Saccharopolyspora spinosa]|nr:hypothetical protein [Saccharopolyspora spinosa]
MIVVEENKHEETEMRALANEFGDDHHVYSNISQRSIVDLKA